MEQEQTLNKPAAKNIGSEPAGYLLGKYGLLAMLLMLLAAAWFGQVLLVILTGLVLSACVLAKLWGRYSLARVNCERFISEQRLFPGESTELKLHLVNRKILPLPWIQVEDDIPCELVPEAAFRPGKRLGFNTLSNTTSLLWYTGINWRYRLTAEKRGYYRLGPMEVFSGDIFGLYPHKMTLQIPDHVIVYPKIYPLVQLGLPSLYPLGEIKAERRIFEDPTRTIGVRDHTPHDGLRHIHWKASARHQKLQVKVFEPTTTLKVALFLAVDSFEQEYGLDKMENFELGVSTVASIANYVAQQRSPLGVYVNSRLPDSPHPVRIPPGSGMNQLVNVLEALAKVTLVSNGTFDEFFQNARGGLPWGTTFVVVISKPLDYLPTLLAGLREAGHKALVIQVGKAKDGGIDNDTTWYNVKHPDELLEIRENR